MLAEKVPLPRLSLKEGGARGRGWGAGGARVREAAAWGPGRLQWGRGQARVTPGLCAGAAGDGEDDAGVLVRQRRGPPDRAAHQEDPLPAQRAGGREDLAAPPHTLLGSGTYSRAAVLSVRWRPTSRFCPALCGQEPGPQEGQSPGDSLTPTLGLRHRHLLYLPPSGTEPLRANGVENSVPQPGPAVVGSSAKPGAPGEKPGMVTGGLGGPGRSERGPC